MAIHIDSVELTSLREGVTTLPGERDVFLLVRWNGVPVGVARLPSHSVADSDQLRAEILRQITPPPEPPLAPKKAAALTIVVCTRNRARDLTRCLDSLMPLAADGHEVLVVDNAPTNNETATVAARYPIRYVCEPRIGLNNARNRGLAEARRHLVAYVDDDAIVDRYWADALAEPFANPNVGCATGLVLPLELRTRAQEQFEMYSTQRRTFAQREFTSATLAPAAAGVVGIGANMAIRRTIADELGGFDPRLDAGTRTCSGGDNDIFARVLDAGCSIVYTPRALAWHRHRDTESELKRCVFGYGVGVFAFFTKRVVERRDLNTLFTAARWFVGPFLRAGRQRVSGLESTPLSLLLFEAAGASLGPFRFFAERRADLAQRRR